MTGLIRVLGHFQLSNSYLKLFEQIIRLHPAAKSIVEPCKHCETMHIYETESMHSFLIEYIRCFMLQRPHHTTVALVHVFNVVFLLHTSYNAYLTSPTQFI